MTRQLSALDPSPADTRRPGVPARAVVLADGRTWGLALPEPRYRPDTGTAPGGDTTDPQLPRVAVRVGYPWPLERLVDRLRVACSAEPGPASDGERFDSLMALAAALLQRAHDLNSAEIAALVDLDSNGLSRLVDAVLDAIDRPNPFNPGGADA